MGLGEARPSPFAARASASRTNRASRWWPTPGPRPRSFIQANLSRSGGADEERRARPARARRRTATRPLPSRLSRSVPESHRVHPRPAAGGSRTGSHRRWGVAPRPEDELVLWFEVYAGPRAVHPAIRARPRPSRGQPLRRSTANADPALAFATCFISVATATASP